MKLDLLIFASLGLALGVASSAIPCAQNGSVTYEGIYLNEVEAFLGIQFGQPTGGKNRFRPPVPYVPAKGATIVVDRPGLACPQPRQAITPAESLVTYYSEDCLRLNVWRPNSTAPTSKLPVLLWIYVGGFDTGTKDYYTWQPGEMLLQSVANGYPIIHVEINYRLGVFGFAQSAALKAEGSENAGLRDQRLAIEWVRDNIAAFGGDPDKVTIHGQSSGGLSVGMQILAYGGSKPAPFQQGICESQVLEPGITGNFTREAMGNTWNATSCNSTSLDSKATLKCLRALPLKELLDAQLETTSELPSANLGDQWLPVVDGDFLPAAPSQLIAEHKFAKVNTIMGWCDNDAVLLTPRTLSTPRGTQEFFKEYLPAMTASNLNKLLSLYPESDFSTSYFANGSVDLHSEVYRAGRILRDILFTCQPILYGQALTNAGQTVYYYDQNQTLDTADLEAAYGAYGDGVTHGSEIIYVFGNLTLVTDNPAAPQNVHPSDIVLRNQESRSWSSFTSVGRPSLPGHDTLAGWLLANYKDENYGVYIIGGPNAGYSGPGGRSKARAAMAQEKLVDRCGFLNQPAIVKQIQY